jgi:hypothetical protein
MVYRRIPDSQKELVVTMARTMTTADISAATHIASRTIRCTLANWRHHQRVSMPAACHSQINDSRQPNLHHWDPG